MAFPDEGQRLALEAVLRPGGLSAVVQPIVRLADGLFVGYEALARVAGGEPPDALLRRAQAEGRRGDIEIAILRAAATLGPPPGGRLLFVSVGPGLLDDERLREVIDRLPERLVLGITQDQPMTDESCLRTTSPHCWPVGSGWRSTTPDRATPAFRTWSTSGRTF